MQELAADPVFADPEWHDLSRDEVRLSSKAGSCRWVSSKVCCHARFDLRSTRVCYRCCRRASPPSTHTIHNIYIYCIYIQVRERTILKLRAAYKLLIVDGSDVARRNARLEIHALQDLGGWVMSSLVGAGGV